MIYQTEVRKKSKSNAIVVVLKKKSYIQPTITEDIKKTENIIAKAVLQKCT